MESRGGGAAFQDSFGHPDGKQLHHPDDQQRVAQGELVGHFIGQQYKQTAAGKAADVKAKLDQSDAYYYPDVMVSCEKSPNPYYREQPSLIVEVLSPTTAKFDTGDKRRDYQSLPSLQEYVLVSTDCMDVRVWRREESDWKVTIYTDGMMIPLTSVGLDIPIEDIYEEVWV